MDQIQEQHVERELRDAWDKLHPYIAKLASPEDMSILRHCVTAFELNEGRPVSIDNLLAYCSLHKVGCTRDHLWKVLWCISNLQLRYRPRDNALVWNGDVFKDKSWYWEARNQGNKPTDPNA